MAKYRGMAIRLTRLYLSLERNYHNNDNGGEQEADEDGEDRLS